MALAADWTQTAFGGLTRRFPLLPLVVTPAGFALCAWATQTYAPGAQGSGIPQAIAARELPNREERTALLSIRLVAIKFTLLLIAWLCGASAGRGGPSAQIGAAIMLKASRHGGLTEDRGLILAGVAAGFATAFDAPLAGIVFAIEIVGGPWAARTVGLVASVAVLAWLASVGLAVRTNGFGDVAFASLPRDWLVVLLCGVCGGLLGGGFSRLLLAGKRAAARWLPRQTPFRRLGLPLGCGLVVALLGVASNGATYGTGYQASAAVLGGQMLAWSFVPAKLLATMATSLSGIPAGILAPSLVVGAGLGGWLAGAAGGAVGLGAMLGMAGFFAGAMQTPFAAILLVLEINGHWAAMPSIAVAAALGYGVARLLLPAPLDRLLAGDFLAASEAAKAALADDQASNSVRPI